MLSFDKKNENTGAGLREVTAFALLAVFWSQEASAQTATMGDVVCNVMHYGLEGYSYMLRVASYCIGVFFALKSMLLLKQHTDNPGQTKLTPPIAYGLAAGAMTSLPTFMGIVVNSVLGVNHVSGTRACSPGAVQPATNVGLDTMLIQFVSNLYQPVFMLIAFIGFIVGGTFVAQALMRAARSGSDPRESAPKGIIVNLLFGGFLMALSTALPSILGTLFGTAGVSNMGTTSHVLQWSNIVGAGVNTTAADNALRAALAFVQIVGGISFLRGWLLLKKAVEGGQATIPQGLTHIIAGAMCINIDIMISLFDETFGTNLIG